MLMTWRRGLRRRCRLFEHACDVALVVAQGFEARGAVRSRRRWQSSVREGCNLSKEDQCATWALTALGRTSTQKQRIANRPEELRGCRGSRCGTHKARTLWNTNVWPTVGYGISGRGVSPTVVRTLRATLAEASNGPPGSCCTTNNAVVHELKDPGVAIPCQTVKDWIGLWLSTTQRQRARVVWHRARRRLGKLKHP